MIFITVEAISITKIYFKNPFLMYSRQLSSSPTFQFFVKLFLWAISDIIYVSMIQVAIKINPSFHIQNFSLLRIWHPENFLNTPLLF